RIVAPTLTVCFSQSLTLFLSHHTPPTDIYTLSYTTLFRSQRPSKRVFSYRVGVLSTAVRHNLFVCKGAPELAGIERVPRCKYGADRKSTRLNSSHVSISYAVFCLKKKKKIRRRSNIYTTDR